ADPTRLKVFESVAAGPKAVVDIAAKLPVTRPAVSQHLKALKDAGLVAAERQGARNVYRLDPKGIGAMRDWLDGHWDRALDAFKEFAGRELENDA
ncbi:MAG: metalloregulator ArsR/SmtB family transcription factor, partial [Parvularculaceae bacterium]